MNYDLANRSAAELEHIARAAVALAKDLRQRQPSIELALEHGVEDRSYSTVRWGRVPSFCGEATIRMDGGFLWKAVGHGPSGTAEYVSSIGWVEFIPVDEI